MVGPGHGGGDRGLRLERRPARVRRARCATRRVQRDHHDPPVDHPALQRTSVARTGPGRCFGFDITDCSRPSRSCLDRRANYTGTHGRTHDSSAGHTSSDDTELILGHGAIFGYGADRVPVDRDHRPVTLYRADTSRR